MSNMLEGQNNSKAEVKPQWLLLQNLILTQQLLKQALKLFSVSSSLVQELKKIRKLVNKNIQCFLADFLQEFTSSSNTANETRMSSSRTLHPINEMKEMYWLSLKKLNLEGIYSKKRYGTLRLKAAMAGVNQGPDRSTMAVPGAFGATQVELRENTD